MGSSSKTTAAPPPPLDISLARAATVSGATATPRSSPVSSPLTSSSTLAKRGHQALTQRSAPQQWQRSFSEQHGLAGNSRGSASATSPSYASSSSRRHFAPHSRTSSDSSVATASSPRKPSSPSVNVYTHCGRHTDQFLFGGHGFADFVRSFKREGGREEDAVPKQHA